MGKPKRVIVWEGDTSNLPNRNEIRFKRHMNN